MTAGAFEEAKLLIMPYLWEQIGDMTLDEVDFSGGKLWDITTHMPQPANDSI